MFYEKIAIWGFLHSGFGTLQSTCGRVALCCPDCARRNVRRCRLFALQPALRRHAAKNYLRENTSCRACAGIHEGPKRLQLRRTVQIVREIANVILRCYDDNESDEIPQHIMLQTAGRTHGFMLYVLGTLRHDLHLYKFVLPPKRRACVHMCRRHCHLHT